MSETTTGGSNAVLGVIQTITQIAMQSNVAVATIFGLIKAVRDAWPRRSGEPAVPDDVLIAMMKDEFEKNRTRNAELIDAILHPTPPPSA